MFDEIGTDRETIVAVLRECSSAEGRVVCVNGAPFAWRRTLAK